jgi:hypothetical protein
MSRAAFGFAMGCLYLIWVLGRKYVLGSDALSSYGVSVFEISVVYLGGGCVCGLLFGLVDVAGLGKPGHLLASIGSGMLMTAAWLFVEGPDPTQSGTAGETILVVGCLLGIAWFVGLTAARA